MQVGVGRSGKHDPRARIARSRWQATSIGVERPRHHLVWTDRYSRAASICRISRAVLSRAAEHIDDSRRNVGRLGFPCFPVHHPLHLHWIHAHGWFTDFVEITWCADPLVAALMKYFHLACAVHDRHRRILRD